MTPNYRKPEQSISQETFYSLVLRVEALERMLQSDGKDDLVERGVALGIGPKSTLQRWSVDKLKIEIENDKRG